MYYHVLVIVQISFNTPGLLLALCFTTFLPKGCSCLRLGSAGSATGPSRARPPRTQAAARQGRQTAGIETGLGR